MSVIKNDYINTPVVCTAFCSIIAELRPCIRIPGNGKLLFVYAKIRKVMKDIGRTGCRKFPVARENTAVRNRPIVRMAFNSPASSCYFRSFKELGKPQKGFAGILDIDVGTSLFKERVRSKGNDDSAFITCYGNLV